MVTGFANTNQIFIRYRIGDLAAWGKGPCPCGRDTLPTLQSIVGRLEDTAVLPDGRRMAYLDFLFKQLTGVIEGQIIQESLDKFVVKVVPASSFSSADEEEIRKRAAVRMGPDIKVEIQKVSSIPREANGKLRLLISHVPYRPATGFVSFDGG